MGASDNLLCSTFENNREQLFGFSINMTFFFYSVLFLFSIQYIFSQLFSVFFTPGLLSLVHINEMISVFCTKILVPHQWPFCNTSLSLRILGYENRSEILASFHLRELWFDSEEILEALFGFVSEDHYISLLVMQLSKFGHLSRD